MLTIPRSTLRQYLQMLRKAGMLKTRRGQASLVVRIYADVGGLTLTAQTADCLVSYSLPGHFEPVEWGVPLACLADCSQHAAGEVSFQSQEDQLMVRWTDHDIPRERVDELCVSDQIPTIPTLPTNWSECTANLLTALQDAGRCTDPDSSRYAMGCLQLDGQRGQITATDGRQALIQGGYSFPWTEQVLIPACPILASKLLPQNETLHIGKTEQHVVLLIGPWTIRFRINEGRFPDVARIIPAESAIRTRLQLDPADIEFVIPRLKHLPQAGDLNQAVTVDLNGSVAIRSRPSSDLPPTELILSRSHWRGTEMRLCTNRQLLQRVLEFGFTEIGFTSPDGPAVCRDGQREYVWALLDAESAVPPTAKVHRVESQAATIQPQHHPGNSTEMHVPTAHHPITV